MAVEASQITTRQENHEWYHKNRKVVSEMITGTKKKTTGKVFVTHQPYVRV